jgi:hypothetical protein
MHVEGDSMMGMDFRLAFIYEIRRRLNELKPRLTTNVSEAVNIARQELCSALVRRLEIAENQIRELEDMLELERKP